MSASTLARDFVVSEKEELECALEQYNSLLRSNLSKPETIRQLRTLASRLDKSADEVAADAQVIQRARYLRQFIAENVNVGALVQEASARMAQSRKELDEAIAKLKAAHQGVADEYARVGGINRAVREAHLELRKLGEEHADLLREAALQDAA